MQLTTTKLHSYLESLFLRKCQFFCFSRGVLKRGRSVYRLQEFFRGGGGKNPLKNPKTPKRASLTHPTIRIMDQLSKIANPSIFYGLSHVATYYLSKDRQITVPDDCFKGSFIVCMLLEFAQSIKAHPLYSCQDIIVLALA